MVPKPDKDISRGKKKAKYWYPPLIYTKTGLTKDLANKTQQYKKE